MLTIITTIFIIIFFCEKHLKNTYYSTAFDGWKPDQMGHCLALARAKISSGILAEEQSTSPFPWFFPEFNSLWFYIALVLTCLWEPVVPFHELKTMIACPLQASREKSRGGKCTVLYNIIMYLYIRNYLYSNLGSYPHS